MRRKSGWVLAGFGLDAEDLAEVVVAVDADALAEAGGVAVEGGDAGEEVVAVGEELGGEGPGLRSESWGTRIGGVLERRTWRASRAVVTCWWMRWRSLARSSGVVGTAAKAGLSVGVARARWSSAVRWPRRAAASR